MINLRIALLTYEYSGKVYGSGRYAKNLVRALSRAGIKVDIYTLGYYVKSVGPILLALKNAFKNFDYEIIHSIDIAGALVKKHPQVVTVHHDYSLFEGLEGRFAQLLVMHSLSKADRIIVPSYYTKRMLPLKLRNKAIVIHHGVDHGIFRKDERQRIITRRELGLDKFFIILNIGRAEKRKGQEDLIKILRGIPGIAVILVGRGTRKLAHLLEEAGIRTVQFEYVSDRKLVSLYNASDIYLHTSRLEGFGLTILEAMATGTPILAYETADLKQIVRKGGFLVKVGDVQKVNEILGMLLKNPHFLTELGEEAFNESRRFSWENSAKKHLEVYERLLS